MDREDKHSTNKKLLKKGGIIEYLDAMMTQSLKLELSAKVQLAEKTMKSY